MTPRPDANDESRTGGTSVISTAVLPFLLSSQLLAAKVSSSILLNFTVRSLDNGNEDMYEESL